MFVEPLPLMMTMLAFAAGGGALAVYFGRFQRRMRGERCSFCGSPRAEVQVLIPSDEGPGEPAYICANCIGVCDDVLREARIKVGPEAPDPDSSSSDGG